ncbi:MAG: SiaB family protein kinase [Bacteroidales bacterium]|jgi:hypothetical protein|nr:SiaB family protein kinase [Bacteroidales bacterium]
MQDTTNNSLFEELKDDTLSFIYLGKFDNTVLGFATEILKGHMTQADDTEGKKNKMSFLMIESFQNILRYGVLGREENETSGEIFMVRKTKGSYYITTGNFVENANIGPTREKLERVNSLTPEELKKLFLETLQNKKISQQGGAGLGFMEMVRKTKEKLDFDFVKISDTRSFFYFQIRLKNTEADNSPALGIDGAKRIKTLMENGKRFIAMKGDFNRSAVNPILSMAENNFGENSIVKQKKVYHILVEMLQNIAKHAKPTEEGYHLGLFSMGLDKDVYTVSATNGIEPAKKVKLENYIKSLNDKNKTELDEYYKVILRNGHDDKTIFSGLGLIDIARDSIVKIDYAFQEYKENLHLFSLTAKV